MTVRFYTAEDAGAPQINGASPGQILAVLDACLVDGYGGKAPAGWSKPFANAGNIGAYEQGAGSNGMFLRLDDSATGNARSVYLRGFESMTDLNSGEGAFPLPTQLSNGVESYASAASTAGPRLWAVVADERAFYFWGRGRPEISGPDDNFLFFFGDIVSYRPEDAFATVVVGHSASLSSVSYSTLFAGDAAVGITSQSSPACWAARAYEQGGGSIEFGKHSDYAKMSSNAYTQYFGTTGIGYPNGPDGGLYLARVWGHESGSANALRGHFPGLWAPCHPRPFQRTSLTTFSGTGPLAGREFVGFSSRAGQVAVEISDTWR